MFYLWEIFHLLAPIQLFPAQGGQKIRAAVKLHWVNSDVFWGKGIHVAEKIAHPSLCPCVVLAQICYQCLHIPLPANLFEQRLLGQAWDFTAVAIIEIRTEALLKLQ